MQVNLRRPVLEESQPVSGPRSALDLDRGEWLVVLVALGFLAGFGLALWAVRSEMPFGDVAPRMVLADPARRGTALGHDCLCGPSEDQ